MQFLKKFNIFRSKKKSGTESPGIERRDTLSSSLGEFDEVDLNVTENDVIESERDERKSSEEKLEFEKLVKKLEGQDYWTGQCEEKSKMQKKESLNIAWCGASNFDGKPKCEWSLNENGGLFGETGVGTMRKYWGKY